ncbi:MAG: hypothetical protein KY410_04320 [Proteobacteria bacterium]|nr:hypothetical protein [Pseudomonadota bacterium]
MIRSMKALGGLLLAGALASTTVAGCGAEGPRDGVHQTVTPEAESIEGLFWFSLTLGVVIWLAVIALLAAVSFDGLLETPGWLAVQIWIENSAGWRPLLLAVHAAGINLLAFVKTLALLAAPLVFTMAYLTCVGIMRVIGGDEGGLARLFNGFALSLVPIAAAYHLAHYLSYLSIAGQHLVPLLSDPFGFGWNLFDTRDYTIRIGLVSPKAVWIFSAIAIVTGHLVSIALAHWQASSVYRDSRRVIASQLPMVVLMIGYTMVSLWILSQPIIETG